MLYRHAMLKNKEDKNVCEQDPLVGIILDQQTDFMDSGLGESRDHRNTFDFSFNHKRRPSIISLEHPEFSDLYRCIISPNAPSSGSSSFGSEVDDPWTRLSDCQRALSYEAFDIGVGEFILARIRLTYERMWRFWANLFLNSMGCR